MQGALLIATPPPQILNNKKSIMYIQLEMIVRQTRGLQGAEPHILDIIETDLVYIIQILPAISQVPFMPSPPFGE